MFFDANLGNIGAEAQMTAIVETAQVADELGFRALWSADHLLAPLSAPQFGRVFEPLVALAYIASITQRIRLGTSVIVLPMRSPFVVAKQVATLDALSNGRVILGIGAAGWSAEEFANVHADFRTRGMRMDEAIRLFRHLWSGSQEAFDGRFYGYPGGAFEPLPAQGKDLPLLVGGRSDAALKRAARHAAFWHSYVVGREFELTVAKLRAEPGGERVEVGGTYEFTGDLDQARTDIEAWAAAGAQHLSVSFGRVSRMRDFAREFLPAPL